MNFRSVIHVIDQRTAY